MRSLVHRIVIIANVALAADAAAQEELPPAMRSLDFREVVRDAKAQVWPAVVYIRVVQETHQAGERVSQEVSGSGVLISPGGEVVTNWHVVDKAVQVRCLLSDGRAMDAAVIGTDKTCDLGLLQLDLDGAPADLPHASFGDSVALLEGDFVMAMGAPWGLNRSVSIGIISCTNRFLDANSEYSLWLQTDAAINPGNSGGPLVNTAGEVVGINTLGMGGEGMGFAIPAGTVRLVIGQIRDYGKVNWSWTGLQLQPLRDFRRDIYFEGDDGVIIAETDPESPARRAGLLPRDRILSVNGEPVAAITEEDLPALRRMLALLPMGQPMSLEVRRGDERLIVEVEPREKGTVEGGELDCPRWDLAIKEINQFDNPDLYFHRTAGVFIYGTKYPGNAANSGLREKDIILKIDGRDVLTLDDVKVIHAEAIENIDARHRIIFHVLRGGLPRQVVLDFSRDHSRK